MTDVRGIYDALLDAWNRRNADQFAEPMERAATRQQYLTALENARQILERLHGPVKATEFSHRGRALGLHPPPHRCAEWLREPPAAAGSGVGPSFRSL